MASEEVCDACVSSTGRSASPHGTNPSNVEAQNVAAFSPRYCSAVDALPSVQHGQLVVASSTTQLMIPESALARVLQTWRAGADVGVHIQGSARCKQSFSSAQSRPREDVPKQRVRSEISSRILDAPTLHTSCILPVPF